VFSCCFAEKELNELLKEVFDGYESDASDTRATADADVEPDEVQLPSTDDVDAQTEQSNVSSTPRKLRNRDHLRHDEDDEDEVRKTVHTRKSENNEFQYPGHIPPLKYVSTLSLFMSSFTADLRFGYTDAV